MEEIIPLFNTYFQNEDNSLEVEPFVCEHDDDLFGENVNQQDSLGIQGSIDSTFETSTMPYDTISNKNSFPMSLHSCSQFPSEQLTHSLTSNISAQSSPFMESTTSIPTPSGSPSCFMNPPQLGFSPSQMHQPNLQLQNADTQNSGMNFPPPISPSIQSQMSSPSQNTQSSFISSSPNCHSAAQASISNSQVQNSGMNFSPPISPSIQCQMSSPSQNTQSCFVPSSPNCSSSAQASISNSQVQNSIMNFPPPISPSIQSQMSSPSQSTQSSFISFSPNCYSVMQASISNSQVQNKSLNFQPSISPSIQSQMSSPSQNAQTDFIEGSSLCFNFAQASTTHPQATLKAGVFSFSQQIRDDAASLPSSDIFSKQEVTQKKKGGRKRSSPPRIKTRNNYGEGIEALKLSQLPGYREDFSKSEFYIRSGEQQKDFYINLGEMYNHKFKEKIQRKNLPRFHRPQKRNKGVCIKFFDRIYDIILPWLREIEVIN